VELCIDSFLSVSLFFCLLLQPLRLEIKVLFFLSFVLRFILRGMFDKLVVKFSVSV